MSGRPPRPPRPATLFPYTTLFRSLLGLRWLPKPIRGSSPDARLTRLKRWRDALVALVVGAGVATVAYAAMMHPVSDSVSRFFLERAYVEGGEIGRASCRDRVCQYV